jgi:hypothetical protein
VDEGRDEKALVWAGHVTIQKMAVFDSYSSRSGEIFFNEIHKSSKQINSQNASQSILFMCSEFWHESAEISEDSLCFLTSKIYRYFWRFSTTGKAACIQAASRRLHASGDSHEICFFSS